MLQDPTGRAAAGQAPPNAGPAVQDPIPPIAPPRLPQEPVQPVTVGADSPPAVQAMRFKGGAQPPPAPTGWIPPPELPPDRAEGEAVLQRLMVEARQQIARDWHQHDLDIQGGIAEAPMLGEQLLQQMRLEPDAEGQDEALQGLEPFLPPSKATHLKETRRRVKEGKTQRQQFQGELEQEIRGKYWKAVRTPERDEYDRLTQERKTLQISATAGGEEMAAARARHEAAYRKAHGLPAVPDPVARTAEIDARLKELEATGDMGTVSWEDPLHGAFSMFSGESTVQDSMHAAAKRLIAKKLQGKPELPPGWTEDTYRAAMTDAAFETIAKLKRPTEGADLARGISDTLAWLPIGIGEVKASAQAAKQLARVPWLKNAPKLLKAGQATTTYVAGPGALEGAFGYVRPLQAERQAELETIPAGERRESTESAYRFLQATQDASLSVLFSLGDAARLFRGITLPAPSPGQAVSDAVKLGLMAPPAVEAVGEASGQAATLLAENEGEAADVLRDMYASKGMYGPVRKTLEAVARGDSDGIREGLLEYGKQALPMMAGVGAAHLAGALQRGSMRRKDMLELRRQVEKDLRSAGLDPEVQQAALAELTKGLENATISKAEDERAGRKEKIEGALGERGESAVLAEDVAGRLLPDVPGTALEKVDALRRRAEQGDADAARQLPIAERSASIRNAEDAAEARVRAAMAEREATPPELAERIRTGIEQVTAQDESTGRWIAQQLDQVMAGGQDFRGDVADTMLDVADRHNLPWLREAVEEIQRRRGEPLDVAAEQVGIDAELRTVQDPAAGDAAAKAVERDVDAEWKVVGSDADAGTVTLRTTNDDGTVRRVTVPGAELGNVRLAEPQEGAAVARMPDEGTPRRVVVDDVFNQGVELVRKGATSARKLSRRMGIGRTSAAKLLRDMEAAGKVRKLANGAYRWVDPTKPPPKPRKQGRKRPTSMVTRVRQLGGIDPESWNKSFPGETRGEFRLGGIVRKGGMSWEAMAQQLTSEGYGPVYSSAEQGGQAVESFDSSWFVQALADAESGIPAFSRHDDAGLSPEAMARQEEEYLASRRPSEPEAEAVPETEARDEDAAALREQLFDDIDRIGRELAEKGESLHLHDQGARMAEQIADYGDVTRPDNPEEGSIQLVAHLLLQLPPDQRTPALIKALGLPKTAHGQVVDHMLALEEPVPKDAPAPDPNLLIRSRTLKADLTTAEAAAALHTDLAAAAKGPTLHATSDAVQKAHADALAAGKSEGEAAEAAFRQWSSDEGVFGKKSHAEFVNTQVRIVDAMHEGMLDVGNVDVHRESCEQLADQVGALGQADGMTAMLSLTPESRAVLKRIDVLWRSMTQKLEIPALAPLAQQAPDRAARRRRLAERLAKQRAQRGATFNPLAPLGSVLVTPVWAAQMVLRAARWALSKVFRGTMKAFSIADRALTAPIRWPIDVAWRALRGTRATRLQRMARRVAERGEAIHSKWAGTKRGRGAELLFDQLTKWDEADLVLAYEQAAAYTRLAEEAKNLLNKVLLKEDSDFDTRFNRYLEQKGTPNQDEDTKAAVREFESAMTPTQREVADAVRAMYGSIRELVAGELLPTQIVRKRHIRLVEKLLAQQDGSVAELQAGLSAAEAARSDVRARGFAKESGEARDAQKAVRRAQAAAKKALEARDATQKRLDRLRAEKEKERQTWGIQHEGFAPAVPAVDLDGQRKAASELMAEARDRAWDPAPQPPRAGHWMRRKDALEAAGIREASALRSFFHYVREVYRLIPAARWYDKNLERVFGESEWVSQAELESGQLNDKGREVWWMSGAAPSVRSDVRYRLGGSVYELVLQKGDQRRSVHFRTFDALDKARKATDPSRLVGQDETGWTVAPKQEQKHGRQVLLLPAGAATVRGANRKARAQEVPTMLTTMEGTERLVFDQDTARIVWPTTAVGHVYYQKPGKYHVIAGADAATGQQFADYVHTAMRQIQGLEVMDTAQRVATLVASGVRHNVLGLLQPKRALKELLDTHIANTLIMGHENALEALGWAAELGEKLRSARAAQHADPAAFLREITPDPKTGEIRQESLLRAIRTEEGKLPKGERRRAERRMLDDAFEDFLGSWLSGDSISEHYGMGTRDFAPGQKVTFQKRLPESVDELRQMATGALRTAGTVSWWARHRAQTMGMRQTWLGAYMLQRRAGADRAAAKRTANEYAMAQGNVGNRVSQSKFFQTATGTYIKPLASWNAAVSATNWRYFLQRGAAKAASRIAYYLGMIYVIQQTGQLLEVDLVQSLGGGAGQIPLIGPYAAWSLHKLQYYAGLAADPADVSGIKTRPQWRKDFEEGVREHAPSILREWLIRKGRSVGGFPADVPVPPFAGTWSPYVAEAASDFFTGAVAAFEGDQKTALEKLYGSLFGSNEWAKAWNRLHGTAQDPSDPSYALVQSPVTGITRDRVKKEQWGSVIWNAMVSDLDTSIERLRRSVLEPQRDKMRAAETRTASYQAQRDRIDAKTLRAEAARASSPEAAATLTRMAENAEQSFIAKVRGYAGEREMTGKERLALVRRWKKAADANMALTSSERDIINAYDSETAFLLMARALDDVTDPMTRERYNRISKLWFADIREQVQSLAMIPKESRRTFQASLRTAKLRWATPKEQR